MPFIGEHYFDYSQSSTGVNVDMAYLFGQNRNYQSSNNSMSGTALTSAFGGGRNYQIIHYEDAWGNPLEMRVYDSIAGSYDTTVQTEPVPSGFSGGTSLVFAVLERATGETANPDGGQYIQFNGIAALTNAYGAASEHVYAPPGTTNSYAIAQNLQNAATAFYEARRDEINAIELDGFDSIDIVQWSAGAEAYPEFHLNYRARVTTDLTIGDIANGTGRWMQMAASTWIGDAVVLELALTDMDDVVTQSIPYETTAETTEIYAGAGADRIYLSITDSSPLAGTRYFRVFGEAGNDTIEVRSHGDRVVELSGGAGHDIIMFSVRNVSLEQPYSGRIVVTGGDGNDTLDVYGYRQEGDGMGSRNLADGGAGDDHIRVDIYMDTVLGGEGDDFIVGTDQLVSHLLYERGNYMSGGSGNDDIRGSMGSDTLSGDEGNDTLHATPGIDILEGGVGADIYDVRAHTFARLVHNTEDGENWETQTLVQRADTTIRDTGGTLYLEIQANYGEPQFLMSGNDLTILAGYVQDHNAVVVTIENYRQNALNWTIFAPASGANDADPLEIVEASSLIEVSSLQSLTELGVSTTIWQVDTNGTYQGDWFTDGFFSNWAGSATEDAVSTGGGRDFIDTGDGSDRIDAGNDDDFVFSGDGALDVVIAGSGDDFVRGGETSADLRDIIYGGDGNDTIDGGYGNDELRGDAGADVIVGGFGVDDIFGGSGNDQLTGQAWSDLLFGGDGDDFINGGFGFDRVNGGAGSDRFFHLGVADHGSDWIQDYNSGDGDVLEFGGAASLDQFQVNFVETTSAGAAGVEEAFVIYRPTGQILWALVDGGAQAEINLVISGAEYDLLSA